MRVYGEIGALIDQGFNYHHSDNDMVVRACLYRFTLTSKIFDLMPPT